MRVALWQHPLWGTKKAETEAKIADVLGNDLGQWEKGQWLAAGGPRGCGKFHLAQARVEVLVRAKGRGGAERQDFWVALL